MNDKWWSTQLALRFCLLWLGGVSCTLAFTFSSTGMIALKYILILTVLTLHVVVVLSIRKPMPVRKKLYREQRIAQVSAVTALISAIGLMCMIGLGLVIQNIPTVFVLLLPLLFFSAATMILAQSIYLRRKQFYKSHCTNCLYDLSAIESSTCPECGRVVTPFETDPS